MYFFKLHCFMVDVMRGSYFVLLRAISQKEVGHVLLVQRFVVKRLNLASFVGMSVFPVGTVFVAC